MLMFVGTGLSCRAEALSLSVKAYNYGVEQCAALRRSVLGFFQTNGHMWAAVLRLHLFHMFRMAPAEAWMLISSKGRSQQKLQRVTPNSHAGPHAAQNDQKTEARQVTSAKQLGQKALS